MAESTFGGNLQKLRKTRGVTQEQLAGVLGVSPQAVSKWENGSYPEGDLLPKLADYFEVSIDYLYGRGSGEVRFEQMVLEKMLEVNAKCEEKNEYEEYFQKVFEILWAMQIGTWRNNNNYYNRPDVSLEDRMGAVLVDNKGYTYMNLGRELEYFVALPKPKDGFEKVLKPTEDMREFFAMLGEEGMLELLCLFFTLKPYDFISEATIASKLGKKPEQIAKLMEMLHKHNEFSGLIHAIGIVGKKDDSEIAYGINGSIVGIYLMLMALATTAIRPPRGFSMQVSRRGEPWLDKEKLDFIK